MRSRIPVFFALALVVAACTAKKADDAAAQTDTTTTAAAATNPPKGTLPPGWENFRSQEFRDSVSSISWSAEDTAKRECEFHSQCPGTSETLAGIRANMEAKLVTPTNGGPTGAVIAKMYLVGSNQHQTRKYHLKPNSTYYAVVKAAGITGGLRYVLMQVANNGNAKVDSVSWGEFQSCNDSPSNDPARASWWGCKSHILLVARTAADSQAIMKKNVEFPDEDGWVSCASGCCTLRPAPGISPLVPPDSTKPKKPGN